MAAFTDAAQQDKTSRTDSAPPANIVQRPAPSGLTLPLSPQNTSNNPFLNPRIASPATLSPALPSPRSAPGMSPRLTPSNPFLAAHEVNSFPQPPTNNQQRLPNMPSQSQLYGVSGDKEDTAQLFHRLTLGENSQANGSSATRPKTSSQNGLSFGSHKPSRSEEPSVRRDPRDQRMRPRPRPPGPKEELDIFASPPKERRPRRNSESSVLSKSSKTEEERRRRERRRREAERGASGTSKDRSEFKARSSKKKPRGMDLIDQLDQTGIFGAGFFHHDGPFDAVNPHRNRRKDERAPMLAFPAGSANMMLGGSGPLNKNIDLERFHGRGAEGFTDFHTAAPEEAKKKSMLSFDPLAKSEPIHAEETHGLGTSTFLEGAPASRRAIERRESESQTDTLGGGGGLARKKSLAQRIRGVTRNDRPGYRGPYGNGATSPETPGVPSRMAQSAGGPSRARGGDIDPFDTLYDDAFDKKGAAIRVAEQERDESGRRPSIPGSPQRNTLERRVTSDSVDEDGKRTGGGFLNRVRSLKGGRGGRYGHGRNGS